MCIFFHYASSMTIAKTNHVKLSLIKTWNVQVQEQITRKGQESWRRYVFKEKHIKQLDRNAEMKVLVILTVLCLSVGYGNSCTCAGVPTNGCDSDYCKKKFIYLFCNFTYLFNWKKTSLHYIKDDVVYGHMYVIHEKEDF